MKQIHAFCEQRLGVMYIFSVDESFLFPFFSLDLYQEVRALREYCHDAKMKSIIAAGELGSLSNIYRASMICMAAGIYFFLITFLFECKFNLVSFILFLSSTIKTVNSFYVYLYIQLLKLSNNKHKIYCIVIEEQF